MKVRILAVLAAAACAHAAKPSGEAKEAKPIPGGVEVEDAIHGVRYELPPAANDMWQVSREGEARIAAGVEAEISYFPMQKSGSGKECRDRARDRATKDVPVADAPRDQVSADDPVPSWSFTVGSAQTPLRNRWAFYSRNSDCIVLRVSGAKDDAFVEQTFDAASQSLRVLALPPDRQREWDLIAGMGFLERREYEAALDRFEALTNREPTMAKAHFGALIAGFELGSKAYARALPHGLVALKSEHDLSPEQRELALRAMGVIQLEENQVRGAVDTLSELVVRKPGDAEAQYNYACALARSGDSNGAVEHLKTAVQLDGDLAKTARADEDLKSLRGQPAFEQLVPKQ